MRPADTRTRRWVHFLLAAFALTVLLASGLVDAACARSSDSKPKRQPDPGYIEITPTVPVPAEVIVLSSASHAYDFIADTTRLTLIGESEVSGYVCIIEYVGDGPRSGEAVLGDAFVELWAFSQNAWCADQFQGNSTVTFEVGEVEFGADVGDYTSVRFRGDMQRCHGSGTPGQTVLDADVTARRE
jgi:hypothetical protein